MKDMNMRGAIEAPSILCNRKCIGGAFNVEAYVAEYNVHIFEVV